MKRLILLALLCSFCLFLYYRFVMDEYARRDLCRWLEDAIVGISRQYGSPPSGSVESDYRRQCGGTVTS